MKKISVVLVAALLVLSCGAERVQAQNAVPRAVEEAFIAAKIPVLRKSVDPVDFSLPLLGGGTAKLSGYKGKVVFLNFWATWCPPCRAEMPAMESLFKRFAGDDFVMIAVDCAEKTADVQAFITETKYTFPVALDSNGAIGGRYGATAIPMTFIFGRDGKIISKVVGSLRWDDPKIIAAFETLLKN
ncbi:hypothetical protein FACS1894161_1860 [Spirochaetia bacterium]|nr:hypothetical protein FACS1894161_1860 [Spirochaetia bacterium]